MTCFLNFRTRTVGGPVNPNPQLYETTSSSSAPGWSLIPLGQITSRVAGQNLLFVTHGFNVTQPSGIVSLGLLDQYLKFSPPNLLIAVLWPGDSAIPLVDYPIEGDVAIDCGQRLAQFCNSYCSSAQSLSFASHSLGARLVLETVKQLQRQARSVCLAAGAINRDCLTTEYAAVADNAERISILASREDYVLKVAYSIGDPFADLLHDDHVPFEIALGSEGPSMPAPTQAVPPWQISDESDFGHSDYLPPSAPDKWPRVADFIRCAFLGKSQTWPA
jgi:hypothetical protein